MQSVSGCLINLDFFKVKRRFFLEKNAYLEYDRRVNKKTQRRVRNVNYY